MTPGEPVADFLGDVKAALADAGFPELDNVQLMELVTDAFAQDKRPDASVPLIHIDPDELVLLAARISTALRLTGLKGPALDQALDTTIRQAIAAIDADRAKDWKRRQKIKLVV